MHFDDSASKGQTADATSKVDSELKRRKQGTTIAGSAVSSMSKYVSLLVDASVTSLKPLTQACGIIAQQEVQL